jgi:hypothetical protein
MKDFLVSIGLNIGLAVSGFFGSLLLIGRQTGKTIKEQILSVIGGTMAANYLTPIVVDFIANEDNTESLQYGIAFIIGFGGLKVVEVIYEKYIDRISVNKYK